MAEIKIYNESDLRAYEKLLLNLKMKFEDFTQCTWIASDYGIFED
ncbi:MAG: hypothetical protein NTX05_02435 [Fusobacteria bacterium]|nr:hypothetical protein [Fusobacteriota bacterium]